MGPFCFVLKKKKGEIKHENVVEDCGLPQAQTKNLEIKQDAVQPTPTPEQPPEMACGDANHSIEW